MLIVFCSLYLFDRYQSTSPCTFCSPRPSIFILAGRDSKALILTALGTILLFKIWLCVTTGAACIDTVKTLCLHCQCFACSSYGKPTYRPKQWTVTASVVGNAGVITKSKKVVNKVNVLSLTTTTTTRLLLDFCFHFNSRLFIPSCLFIEELYFYLGLVDMCIFYDQLKYTGHVRIIFNASRDLSAVLGNINFPLFLCTITTPMSTRFGRFIISKGQTAVGQCVIKQ